MNSRIVLQQSLPFQPQWLIEALGITQLDPSLPQQGPLPRGRDQVEIRTTRNTPQGMQTKVTVVNTVHGCVLQQSIYDCQGRLLATADSWAHRRDPLTGLILPGTVTIRSMMPSPMSMRLDLGPTEINRGDVNLAPYWTPPSYEGYPAVDLCKTNIPRTAGR